MTFATKENPKILIGASIPRSGHHFCQSLLSEYYGDDLLYCEVYHGSCCKTFPCTKRGRFSVIYQKNHDFDMKVPLTVRDALYIVQYRDPVPAVLSLRELDLRDSLRRGGKSYRLTESGYAWWLAEKAVYYRKFHDKWLANRLPNAVYLDYDELIKNPAAALAPVIEWSSGSVDTARLDQIIENARATRANTPIPFRPRVIEESPYFNSELLGAFENFVKERCPAFAFSPRLSGSYRGHSIYGAILAIDPQETLPPGEHDRLAFASSNAPHQPEIVFRQAKKLNVAGDADAAIRVLTRLLTENPLFAPGYRLLINACTANSRPFPPSLLSASAIIACADIPTTLVPLGEAFLNSQMRVNAIVALSAAAVLKPDMPEAHYLLASILFKEGRLKQSLACAETSVSLAPQKERYKRLLSMIRTRVEGSGAT